MSNKSLSEESTKEEVSNYFFEHFRINKELKTRIIEEEISGDVLLEMTDNDFKELGIKLDLLHKIKRFLYSNKDNFKKKEIKEKITNMSEPEQVKNFFERYLCFKGNLNDLNGKELIELKEEFIMEIFYLSAFWISANFVEIIHV